MGACNVQPPLKLHRKDSLCMLHTQVLRQHKEWDRGRWVVSPDMHMVVPIGLAVKAPWVVSGGPTLASCMDRLKKHCSHLVARGLISGREGCFGSEQVFDK